MTDAINPNGLATAIKKLGSESQEFKITPEMTVQTIIDKYISHESQKAQERASSGFFESDASSE